MAFILRFLIFHCVFTSAAALIDVISAWQTHTWTLGELTSFLEDFARWNPSLEPTDSRTKLMKTLMQSCRKQLVRNEIAAGSKTDQAVNALWAAMVYHTPALNHALKTYGNVQQWSCCASSWSLCVVDSLVLLVCLCS